MTKILLIEDEVGLAKIIMRELEKHGYHVLHAGDGLAALRLYEQQQPKLIILDWVLPALDGLEVLRRLRRVSAVPVLMLTGRGEKADQAIAIELGADDYLTKPFSIGELATRVRALLRRTERVQQIVSEDREKRALPLAYQNLTLDPDQRQVTVDGQPVDLDTTEFDLLYLLLRNPGRTFSRTYLTETIGVQDDGSVDRVISGLRKKLGAAGEMIETILGAGYRLRAGP